MSAPARFTSGLWISTVPESSGSPAVALTTLSGNAKKLPVVIWIWSPAPAPADASIRLPFWRITNPRSIVMLPPVPPVTEVLSSPSGSGDLTPSGLYSRNDAVEVRDGEHPTVTRVTVFVSLAR